MTTRSRLKKSNEKDNKVKVPEIIEEEMVPKTDLRMKRTKRHLGLKSKRNKGKKEDPLETRRRYCK
jgi:hypothetical protein